jgi:hypothetical protein
MFKMLGSFLLVSRRPLDGGLQRSFQKFFYSTVQENPDFQIGDELNERKHSSLGMKPHTLVWGECYSK